MPSNLLHIIMPVKDSLATVREAIASLYASEERDWQFTVYDDFSSSETAEALDQMAAQYGFDVIHWSRLTTHPSPNYLLTLQDAQRKAQDVNADLLIVESDVLVQPDTISRLREARAASLGLIAAVTHDEQGEVNFPYLYAKRWKAEPVFTTKRFSFCCTLLTREFLQAFPFSGLNPEKNWFDVTISHKAVELGFRNLLMMNTPVLHKPHSSRPWKQLKYTNPLRYYLLKLLHRRDKI